MTRAANDKSSFRSVDSSILRVILFCVVVAIGLVLWIQLRPRPLELTSLTDYPQAIARIRKRLPSEACAHMPETTDGLHNGSMHFFEETGNKEISLMLRCKISPSAADALADQFRGQAKAFVTFPAAGTGGRTAPLANYGAPRWALIEPSADTDFGLPKDFEILLLHRVIIDPGLDDASAGVAIRHTDGVVLYWVRRHWAPIN